MSFTTEQLSVRRSGITGSDAPIIAGVSPWSTPSELWLEKRHPELIERRDEKRLDWGRRLEKSIAECYADEMNTILIPGKLTRHPTIKWLLGTPDFYAEMAPDIALPGAKRWGLECKNVSASQRKEWGPSGSGVVPMHYLFQALHYMLVTGLTRWDFAVLIDNADFRYYWVLADDEILARLFIAEKDFYENHIAADKMPEPDSFKSLEAFINRKYRRNSERVIEVAGGHQTIVSAMNRKKAARAELKDAKEEDEDATIILKSLMGDAVEMRYPEGGLLARWKCHRDKPDTDWQAVAEEVLPTLPADKAQKLLARHTAVKQGSRVFNFYEKKAKHEEEE